jgi:hypothetical protein
MRTTALLALCSLLLSADDFQRLTYTKTFPGSSPEYLRLSISANGALEYTESTKDDPPLHAQMHSAETAQLFDLAAKLDNFKTPLESRLKVANTGKKVFRFEDGKGTHFETTFNYSTNPLAGQLLDKFENIAASERAYLDLDRAVHFDKLGVNDALANIESLWLRKVLADPAQFFPLLTRISTHESFMHLARERAARLKDEFQKPKPPGPAEGISNSK